MKKKPFALTVEEKFKEKKGLLTDKEKEVLSKYYGIEDVRHTLAELGELFNVTRERIRQIKVTALNKIGINSLKEPK